MYKTGDTIAAIATALGAGGVGIVRISGPDASKVLCCVVEACESELVERRLEYGHVYAKGEVIDEVLYVLMRGPRSFTGEDVAEIHGHGGAANLAKLLQTVIGAGCRHAEAGEFTRRAFENDRIDLTRAEAIADIVNASSDKALREAQSQLQGSLGKVIDLLITETTDLHAEIEAGIDFPEDIISESDTKRRHGVAKDLAQRSEVLAQSFGIGKVLKDGITVVLSGPVNVGKSSLFNVLVGHERAIVAEEAGTTRDYVEAKVVWDGMVVTLVDTAGVRNTTNKVEDIGIAMGVKRAQEADVELLVYSWDYSDTMPSVSGKKILVRSKCDLSGNESSKNTNPDTLEIKTSSKSLSGIDELKKRILTMVTAQVSESAEGCVVTNERQRTRLESAGKALQNAAELIQNLGPAELIVIELNSARVFLTEITGKEVGDEMLDALFSRFCIGK